MEPSDDDIPLTPHLILAAYAAGVFPMSETRTAREVGWYDPPLRGVLPLDRFHVPRRLRQLIRQHRFVVTFDRDFAGVIAGCAGDTAAGPGVMRETWINDDILAVFTALHQQGHAHSVEVWETGADGSRQELVGGVYGLAMQGAFFGESMFSRRPNASKVALVFLAARLWAQGFVLFDAQFHNPHLEQFGLIEITRAEYHAQLRHALGLQQVRFERAYSPPSKDPGSSSSVGTAAVPPDTGATGAICAGVASGAGAGAAAGAVTASSALALSAATAASSGVASGVFSAEYASDAATVASFLQAITQTS